MEKLTTLETVKQKIQDHDLCLFYMTAPDCGVCHADQPRVEALAGQYGLATYQVDIMDLPEARGFFMAFTSPVVALYYQGKEIHRQARIINFKGLEYRIDQVQSALGGY